jgi:hypothetical protein
LGGNGTDYVDDLAIHPLTGEVYAAGYTGSSNFPNTAGGAQPSKNILHDAFVARLSADLTSNLQSTYLGGGDSDWANALAIHPTTGEVYVAGLTYSNDFPHTAGGAQASYGGGARDAFVARLSADLTSNPQSTYLGGSGTDYVVTSLAIHPLTGEVYAAGYTGSCNFPNTAGGAQASCETPNNGFVARLSADLTSNPQSTYLGGGLADWANALAIHPTTGEVYVAGLTKSTDFPHTAGGAQESYGGFSDAFVARLTGDLRGGFWLYLPLVLQMR